MSGARPLLIAVFALAALMATSCRSDQASGTLAAIRARGTITYGADLAGGEPYIYEDPAHPGEIAGFEVDLMNALARRLGVKAKMAQYAWSNLVPSLERGDFDVVTNGLEATAERKDRILLSQPYFIYAETLAVRRGSPYRTLADLKGKRVGTLNQTVAHDMLRAQPLEAVVYEGNEEPYLDLASGRVDAVLLDNIIAERYGCIPARPTIECVKGDVARGTYVIGIRKGDPELAAAIDAAIVAMRADGELERVLRKSNLWDARQTEPAPVITADAGVRARAFDGTQLLLFFDGAFVTLKLSLLAFLIAVPLGLLLAIARVFGNLPARIVARVYIELFRGTPVLLQLFVLYYGLAPYYSMGPVTAAVLGLGLNYAAYEAEVYRGALLAIPRGQIEAARALGMSPTQTIRHILVPQALRLALPPMTNDFVSLLKDSSLVSVITVIELTKRMSIAAVDLRGWLVPGLACALMYLAMSFPLSEFARRLERRLSRDQRPQTL
ncbi:MAG: ABC transporter substrate-binding protein/permease [Proteobacteria bacterium]|nr:ABC transporter substrate-binding protein/permease [Pseudomonadota bacterium]